MKGFRDVGEAELMQVEGGGILSAIGGFLSGLGGGLGAALSLAWRVFNSPGRPMN